MYTQPLALSISTQNSEKLTWLHPSIGIVVLSVPVLLELTGVFTVDSGHFSRPGSQVCLIIPKLHYQIGNIAWELAKPNSLVAEFSTELK